MQFVKYNKIRRLGDRENRGILEGYVYGHEKLDGAQASIICHGEGKWDIASRNQTIASPQDFRGFREYVQNHAGLQQLIKNENVARIYGEWLVKHSVKYPNEALNHFYVYDVDAISESGEIHRLSYPSLDALCERYNLLQPRILIEGRDLDLESIQKEVGGSQFDIPFGEGVVLRNDSFSLTARAKIVHPKFSEVSNSKVRPANTNSKCSFDVYTWAEKYTTLKRVTKLLSKYMLENTLVEVDRTHTPFILKLALEDTLEECLEPFLEETPDAIIDMPSLTKAIQSRARKHFFSIIDNSGVA